MQVKCLRYLTKKDLEEKKMKICPNCNNAVEDSAIFCDKCGNRLAVQNNNPVNYSQQPNNYGVNQPQYQQPVMMQQTQPKKKNIGMIIGIVAAVLLVLAIIGSVAEKAFQDQGYGDNGGNDYTPSYNFGADDSSSNNDTNSTTDNDTSTVKTYNKGSVVDGWYVNEWANMRFDTNGNWTDGSAEEYASYEGDPDTECGIILNDADNGKQLVICFEKLNGLGVSITEEGYLDIVVSGIKQQYMDASINCEVDDYYNTIIAGEFFTTAKLTFDGSTMVQEFHVRKYDDYIIFVGVIAQDNFDASTVVNNIRAIN